MLKCPYKTRDIDKLVKIFDIAAAHDHVNVVGAVFDAIREIAAISQNRMVIGGAWAFSWRRIYKYVQKVVEKMLENPQLTNRSQMAISNKMMFAQMMAEQEREAQQDVT